MVNKQLLVLSYSLTGVGTLGVGVAYFLGKAMPPSTLLTMESGYETTYSDAENIGKKYGWFLVGTYGVKSEETENNEKWWEWSYKNWRNAFRNSEALHDDFKDESKVKSAYSKSDSSDTDKDKALNMVCEAIYKKKTTDLSNFETNQNDLKRDILKFCSPLREKPKTVSENEYGSDEFGGGSDKTKYVAVSVSENDPFWKLRTDEFFGKDGDSNEGTGKNASGSMFQELYKKKSQPKKDRGNLKMACNQAYSSKTSDTTINGDLTKYCAWIW